MKYLRIASSSALLALLVSGCTQSSGGLPRATEVPETELHKTSYALGQSMGKSLKASEIEIDHAYFNAGFYDAQDGTQRMTDEDMQAVLVAMQQAAQQKQMQEHAAVLEESKQAALAYLEQNAQAEGVVTTDSGLQYKVLVEGDGDKPGVDSTVTVHYEGRLIDGTIFDSSLQRGEPATFPVGGVIAGWTEALQLMPVGSKWQLSIPPELAYGERGAGQAITPNAALIFDVELLGIE